MRDRRHQGVPIPVDDGTDSLPDSGVLTPGGKVLLDMQTYTQSGPVHLTAMPSRIEMTCAHGCRSAA